MDRKTIKKILLPVGSIVPDNWLKECLERQSIGLNGNLGKIRHPGFYSSLKIQSAFV